MPSESNAAELDDIRGDMAGLRSAVDVALRTAHEALQRVQQQQPQSEGSADHHSSSHSPSLNEDALHEHLHAFEEFIIRRVRDETARAGGPVSQHADVYSAHLNLKPTAADSVSSGLVEVPTTLVRKMELQLAAHRTRSAAAEQRLGQLESKLNALMADVVEQSQREATHRKQLAAMVHELVEAEVRGAVASPLAPSLQFRPESDHRFLTSPAASPSATVDVSVMHHITAALAAMHERVEEQHAELTQWQQQQYCLMDAIVRQMNELKEKNSALQQELSQLQQGRPRSGQTANPLDAESDPNDAPIVWVRRAV